MKTFLAFCVFVLCGANSFSPASAQDMQTELDKGLAFASAGDYVAARTAWERLARRGNAEAQFRLGWLYETGQGVEINFSTAAGWYASAATREHVGALYNLGIMRAEGRGVLRDDSKAAEYFRRAAIKGYAKAQYNLGILYATGRGVKKDVQWGRYWLDRAKANGVIKSNFSGRG